ncbi:hypothetical protein AVEN_3863-1 [Araneus ventricosus]|uniref:Uncharacterized protein n=1 Tax=Araneus ventricosus TaxID=182803 RepID=A0A4Y2M6B3_ARAVE|nr:hypothetical protein AVEN_3863-1 [Araneus ventricosus]
MVKEINALLPLYLVDVREVSVDKSPIIWKGLFAADALSRNPQKVPYKREELEAEIDAFIQMITSSLPASSRRLDELRVAQLKDETRQKLTDYVLKGWPSKKEVDTLCAPYWQNRYEISVQDGLLVRGCRTIIPKSHQAQVLNQIHEALTWALPNLELEPDALFTGRE